MKINKIELPNHREELGFWLNQHGFLGEGVEIGCAFGGYATIILGSWKGRMLCMVDPWAKQDDYKESTNETAPFDLWYQGCVALANSRVGMTPGCTIVRKRSTDGAKEFQDNCLDWVFIDGNHGYQAVIDDLNAWYPKLRSGGLLSGHDYGNQTEAMGCAGWDCEVERAVQDWLKLHPELKQPKLTPCSSFWILKP
jgi:hypothetical protein